jgi:hypothetical protein
MHKRIKQMVKPVNEKTERVLTELAEAYEKVNATLLAPEKGLLSTLWNASSDAKDLAEISRAVQVITGITSTNLYDLANHARDYGFENLADSFKKSADLENEINAVCPKVTTPDKWYNNAIRGYNDFKAIKKLGSYTQG